jgi:hypothetical protein
MNSTWLSSDEDRRIRQRLAAVRDRVAALCRAGVCCRQHATIWAVRRGDLLCQFKLTQLGCQSILTGVDIGTLAANLSSDDPAIGLRASLALHRLAERVEAHHVAAAREKGWSWQQIGDALGVTRQSVHTKYNKESS